MKIYTKVKFKQKVTSKIYTVCIIWIEFNWNRMFTILKFLLGRENIQNFSSGLKFIFKENCLLGLPVCLLACVWCRMSECVCMFLCQMWRFWTLSNQLFSYVENWTRKRRKKNHNCRHRTSITTSSTSNSSIKRRKSADAFAVTAAAARSTLYILMYSARTVRIKCKYLNKRLRLDFNKHLSPSYLYNISQSVLLTPYHGSRSSI